MIVEHDLQGAPRTIGVPHAKLASTERVCLPHCLLEEQVHGRHVIRKHERECARSYQISRAVAKQSFVGWVGIADDTAGVDDANKVSTVLAQGSEARL